MEEYLKPTSFFDFDHPAVLEFSERVGKGLVDPTEKMVAYYLAVRDGIRYNPYTFKEGERSLKASFCFENHEAFCLPKAVLLGALARHNGVPSRLGLVDVINHLASPKLLEWLKTDIFSMHGYIDLFLNGKWVKATPAFDKDLCRRFGVEPLEFNGVEDSLFQEFKGGQKYMEYIKDHGVFADVPVDFIYQKLMEVYPHLFNNETLSR